LGILIWLKAFRKAYLTPLRLKKSYSQFAEDLLIQQALSRLEDVRHFYVDIGCHHPRRGSNTYALYRRGWQGILVDLEDIKVLACKIARPRDTVVKAAVSNEEKFVQIFSPGAFSTNTTINPDGIENSEQYKPIGRVRTVKLTSLLREHRCPQVFDFLNIDVEGVDLEVLQSLDLNEFRPSLICVENWKAQEGLSALLDTETHRHLDKNGYELLGLSSVSTIYGRRRAS
jgi:FkbM family methyltransferase